MTAPRNLGEKLAVWLDDQASSDVPDGLLDRTMSRVHATRQRPVWLVAPHRGIGARPSSAAFVPAWAIIILAVLAAVAIVAAGSQLFRRPAPAIIAIATFPLSGDPSAAPAPSPVATGDGVPLGGRMILAEAFEGPEVEGPHDLVSIDPSTGARTLLGSVPGPNKPIFSGAHPVAFQRIPADGRVLVLGGDSGQHVDGVTSAGRAFDFIAASEVAADETYHPEGLILSPTGDRVAFIRVDRFDRPLEIVVLSLAGGTATSLPVPGDGLWFGLRQWSPDGSALLASGCRPCNQATTPTEVQTSHHDHLYVVPLDGSPARELGDVDNGSIAGQWAPDGKTIVTATQLCASGGYMPRCDPAGGDKTFGTIRVADGRATELARTDADGAGLWEFKVSPDATRVAYLTNVGIFVRSLDGGEPLGLAEGTTPEALTDPSLRGPFNVDWSPDGRWLLFERGIAELWIVPSSGGNARLLGVDLAGAAW